MAIKPILFNTEMVRAILDGRKTCTRRIVRPPYFVDGDENDKRSLITLRTATKNSSLYRQIGHMPYPDSPYWMCDILYVRETWTEECGKYYYRADYDSDYLDPCETLSGGYPASCRNHPGCDGCMATSTRIHWHPSIHMPKEAARIWLKVTDVRVERLQEITGASIQKEGIEVDPKEYASKFDFISELFLLFQRLWDSVVKKSDIDRYGWDASPWVWVIEFERCEKPKGV